MRKLLFVALMSSAFSCYADQLILTAWADNIRCDYRSCDISGTQDIEIVNDSNADHKYHYKYNIYLEPGAYRPRQVENDIIVKAHTTWNNHHSSSFVSKFSRSGRFISHSTVSVGQIGGHISAYKDAIGEIIASC